MADAQDAPGALRGTAGPSGDEAPGVIIDNRTELPDDQVRQAVMAQWVETASLQFGTPSSFQLYATNQGSSMLSRSPFRTPSNVIEEIKLARQVVDTDDDIQAVVGQSIATAFGDGMQNQHEDEQTVHYFNRIAREMNLDMQLKEMYREYLIAAQVNTLSLFTRSRLDFTPTGTEERIRAQLATPLVGIIPAEQIRVVSNDIFGTGELAYDVEDPRLKDWLDTFFSPRTTAAVKNRMKREQPVLAAVFTGTIEVDWNDQDMFSAGKTLYTLNPRMVHRTTMPKGASAYPRPPLTSNFALLEAKRLLNIMDYALLQGGTNYIVVAKQGSDQLPAQQPEIDNLTDQVRTASRTGVLVGDHRLSIDIITPKLEELLNPAKRKIIGRKLAMALLRIPEQVTDDSGGEGARQELAFTASTITSDRRDIKRHVERFVYDEVVTRNRSTFTKGAPNLWFPKIVLAGVKDFYDSIVKARDRGDIPRKWAVEVLGFDYEAGVAQRRRELEAGDDEVMIPGSVPFSDPGGPPEDNPEGRPRGSSSSNGRPGGEPGGNVDPAQRQRPLVRRRRGEPIRAYWDAEYATTRRVGELTTAVLEEFPGHTVGRVTEIEREAVQASEIRQSGPVVVVPVNTGYAVREIRAFRLAEGLSMIVGQRDDGALVARALCFREPQFDLQRAQEIAMRWGFASEAYEEPEEVTAEPVPPQQPRVMEMVAQALQNPDVMQQVTAVLTQVLSSIQPQVTVVLPEEAETEFVRDENGQIVGKRRVRQEQQ